MTNPFQDYLNDLMSRTEQAMPQFKPHCPECLQPITGVSYNGMCGSCSRQHYREESKGVTDEMVE